MAFERRTILLLMKKMRMRGNRNLEIFLRGWFDEFVFVLFFLWWWMWGGGIKSIASFENCSFVSCLKKKSWRKMKCVIVCKHLQLE